ARFDHVAEHDFLAGIVEARIEPEAAAKPRVLDRPPREGARDLGHVLLRVAAVHAERVQLHQLAAVVLVETPAGILALWRAWRRGQTPRHHEAAERTPSEARRKRGRSSWLRFPCAQPVVEIEQHRRA